MPNETIYYCPNCEALGKVYMVEARRGILSLALRCSACQHEWVETRPSQSILSLANAMELRIERRPKTEAR